MKEMKSLLALVLILTLLGTGFLLMSHQVKAGEEMGQVEKDITKELEDFDNKFGNFFEKIKNEEIKINFPVALNITPAKRVNMVNVKLESATGTDLTVGIFGLHFKVDASTAKITGGTATTTISDLKVGDKLLIHGVIDENTGVIKATRIHDRLLHRSNIESLRARIEELRNLIKKLQEEMKIRRGW